MFRRIGRTFKEAFWGISHHFAMAISTANAVMITLILVVVFTILITNISQITYDVESEIQIYVPIDSSVSEDDIEALQAEIEKIPGVGEITYSSADDELTNLIESFGEDGEIFEIYRGEDNPLSRVFLVTVSEGYSMASVSEQIESIEGVSSATYGGATVDDFIDLLDGIRTVGYAFAGALTLLAIFLIYNTIKITLNSRKEEIKIMRLVGATNGYITAPLIMEGIIIGIMGSVIPVLITIFGYSYIYESLNGQLVSGILTLIPVYPYVYYVSAFAIGIGVVVGFIGSFLSAHHYLRQQR